MKTIKNKMVTDCCTLSVLVLRNCYQKNDSLNHSGRFRELVLVMILTLCSGVLLAQTKSISGQVMDKSGVPYSSVTLMIKGSNRVSLSDKNGNFTLLNVKEGDELSVSAMGEKSMTVKIGRENFYRITMGGKVVAENQSTSTDSGDPTEDFLEVASKALKVAENYEAQNDYGNAIRFYAIASAACEAAQRQDAALKNVALKNIALKAYENRGFLYITGKGVEQNLNEAIEYYKKAADWGSVLALHQLGFCYGCLKNNSQTFYWYAKAAEKGFLESEIALASCYYNGNGVERNIAKAKEWYLKAAEKGNPEAQYMLSACYLCSDEKNKADMDKVVYWLLESGKQNFAPAQYSLGDMLFNDKRTAEDEKGALVWFTLAAINGSKDAENKLREIFSKKLVNVQEFGNYEEWFSYLTSQVSTSKLK